MVKSGLDFYFEIQRAPSEIPANLRAKPIQPFRADFIALGSSNSEGARNFKKNLDHFLPSFLTQKS